MNLPKIVGANVVRLRQQKGWSQEQLSETSGLHRTYISQIETGARNPTLGIIQRLAQSLEVAPFVLLQEPQNKDSGG